MIASAKEKDTLNITLSSCINSTNVHLRNYCTKIFVVVVNKCVCRRSVNNKAAILSYPISYPINTLDINRIDFSILQFYNFVNSSSWPGLQPMKNGVYIE